MVTSVPNVSRNDGGYNYWLSTGTLNSVGFLYLIRVTRLPDCQIAISSGPQAQSHACKAGWPCIGDVLVTILNLCALVRVVWETYESEEDESSGQGCN